MNAKDVARLKQIHKTHIRIVNAIQDSTGKVTYEDMMLSVLELCPHGIQIDFRMNPLFPEGTVLCKDLVGISYEVSEDIYERIREDIGKIRKDVEICYIPGGIKSQE